MIDFTVIIIIIITFTTYHYIHASSSYIIKFCGALNVLLRAADTPLRNYLHSVTHRDHLFISISSDSDKEIALALVSAAMRRAGLTSKPGN